MNIPSRILKQNFLLTSIIGILAIVGILGQIAASVSADGILSLDQQAISHIVYIVVGLILIQAISLIETSYINNAMPIVVIALTGIILLAATLLFGPTIANVKRWLVIGGIQIQTSEIIKICSIFIMAYMVDRIFTVDKTEWWLYCFVALYLLVATLLIFIQPHGSMSIIHLAMVALLFFIFNRSFYQSLYIGVIVVLGGIGIFGLVASAGSWALIAIILAVVIAIFGLYSSNISWKFILIGAAAAVLLGGVFYLGWENVLRDYQKERITTFLSPEDNVQDSGFNVEQSLVAIGSGGILGKGFANGTQSRLQFLPEFRTDFIFASLAEQYGFVGGVVIIASYLTIVLITLYYAYKLYDDDKFKSVLLMGFGIKILLEISVNLGTNLALIPATGIPLPLLSLGGSNILLSCFSFGLIQSIISGRVVKIGPLGNFDTEDFLI